MKSLTLDVAILVAVAVTVYVAFGISAEYCVGCAVGSVTARVLWRKEIARGEDR